MKTIVTALLGSAKPILYAVMFLFVMTTIFAVMGVALFKDSFFHCTDSYSIDGSEGDGRFECQGQFLSPVGDVWMPRAWVKPWCVYAYMHSCIYVRTDVFFGARLRHGGMYMFVVR
jgi:hypothetical protein